MKEKYRARHPFGIAKCTKRCVCGRFWSLITINWQRKPQIRKTLLTKCVPSGFTALNWSRAEQRGPWLKRSRRRVCSNSCSAVSSLQSLYISKNLTVLKCANHSHFQTSRMEGMIVYDYFTREYIMCPHSRGEQECSPICNFPMILIFISSLNPAWWAVAAN